MVPIKPMKIKPAIKIIDSIAGLDRLRKYLLLISSRVY